MILAETLEVTASAEEFRAAARNALRRLENEGIPGLELVEFHTNPGFTEVRGVLVFASPDELMRHIHLIAGWEEFHGLVATVRPIEINVHGRVNAEVEGWLRRYNCAVRIFTERIGGFGREPMIATNV